MRPAPWRKSSVAVVANTLQQRFSEEAARKRAATTPRGASPPG